MRNILPKTSARPHLRLALKCFARETFGDPRVFRLRSTPAPLQMFRMRNIAL